MDRISRALFHHLPALGMDLCLRLLGRRPFLSRLSHRMDKATGALEYFTTRQWQWDNTRTSALMESLRGEDLDKFGPAEVDWERFLESYVLGTRHFLLKCSPGSVEKCRKKLAVLKAIHVVLLYAVIFVPLFFILKFCGAW